MKVVYNKLIRDRIPEILRKKGVIIKTSVLTGNAFIRELFNKLVEEANEVRKAQSQKKNVVEEIADLYEVLEEIQSAMNISHEEIIAAQKEKKQSRGGFANKLFLHYVEKNAPEEK